MSRIDQMGPYESGAPRYTNAHCFPLLDYLPIAAPAFASWSAISLYVSPV